jgi:hypothetical protein
MFCNYTFLMHIELERKVPLFFKNRGNRPRRRDGPGPLYIMTCYNSKRRVKANFQKRGLVHDGARCR